MKKSSENSEHVKKLLYHGITKDESNDLIEFPDSLESVKEKELHLILDNLVFDERVEDFLQNGYKLMKVRVKQFLFPILNSETRQKLAETIKNPVLKKILSGIKNVAINEFLINKNISLQAEYCIKLLNDFFDNKPIVSNEMADFGEIVISEKEILDLHSNLDNLLDVEKSFYDKLEFYEHEEFGIKLLEYLENYGIVLPEHFYDQYIADNKTELVYLYRENQGYSLNPNKVIYKVDNYELINSEKRGKLIKSYNNFKKRLSNRYNNIFLLI